MCIRERDTFGVNIPKELPGNEHSCIAHDRTLHARVDTRIMKEWIMWLEDSPTSRIPSGNCKLFQLRRLNSLMATRSQPLFHNDEAFTLPMDAFTSLRGEISPKQMHYYHKCVKHRKIGGKTQCKPSRLIFPDYAPGFSLQSYSLFPPCPSIDSWGVHV